VLFFFVLVYFFTRPSIFRVPVIYHCNIFFKNYDNNGDLIDSGLMGIIDICEDNIIQVSIQKADSVDYVGLDMDMYDYNFD
jgi:hypothetical protein